MGRVCSTHGENRKAYRLTVERPERKRSLGRPTHLWKDNFKMNLREIEWCCMDWTDQERGHCWALVNTVINIWVP
jgi:hypothetical protein